MRLVRIGLAALCACTPTLAFDVDAAGTAVVPGSPVPAVVTLPANLGGFGNLDLTTQTGFYGAQSKDRITDAHVERFTLRVLSPATQNLSFFTSVAFLIEAPGLPRVQFAHLQPMPAATATDLTLDGGLDLTPYAKAPTITITASATGTAPRQDTQIEAAVTFRIDAAIF